MRESTVLPMAESPFDLSASGAERYRRLGRVTDDVVTDEAGLTVGFQRCDDVEALLTDPRFGAIAMRVLEYGAVCAVQQTDANARDREPSRPQAQGR